MKRITVIGSLNIDHVLKTKNLPRKGETLISESYHLKCGGKGANQAAAIGRIGAEVIMIGKIGDDEAGRIQIDSLKASSVNTDGIIVEKKQKTGTALITVDKTGSNTIVLFPGANRDLSPEDISSMERYCIEPCSGR